MNHIKIRNKYRLPYLSNKLIIKWGVEQKITLKNKKITYYRKGGPECNRIGLDYKDINSLNIMDFITLFPKEILENILKYIYTFIVIKDNPFMYLGCSGIKRTRSTKFIQLKLFLPKRLIGIAYKKIIINVTTNEIKYRCIHCEENNIIYDMDTAQKIQQHCRVHYISKFHCKKCNDSWGIKTSFTNHYIYKCMICNCNLRGISSCYNHINSNKHNKHLSMKL